MRVIPVPAVPNQAFTVTINNVRWSLRLTAILEGWVCDVSRNSVPLLTGSRVLAGEPLIPYRHLMDGNFIFISSDDNIPNYQNGQTLIYLSAAELAALPTRTVAVIRTPRPLFTDEGFYITTDGGELILDA